MIRKSVFETNSSSAHSLAFATDISNAVYDTIYPDEDGYVVVDCSDYSFVRQVPRITNDTKEKIAFFASLWGETYYDDEEKMELLESVIKANSKAHKVVFLGFNYVAIDFKNDFDLPQDFDELYRVIFDKNCYLRIAGDEYDFASEEDEELFNNPPIVKAEKYKNKLVRTSVFETNSSSAHSLSINKGNKVLNVFDTLKPDKNGVVRIDCGGYKFTRQKPRRTNDTKEKIAFFATLFDSLTYYKKELEELVALIKQNSLCEEVIFENLGSSHIDFCGDFTIPEGLQMYRALFDKNSWLFLIGDEYWFESDKEEEEFFNVPVIEK